MTKYSYIEIVVDDDCLYVNSFIRDKVRSILNQYFAPVNCKIGQIINTNDILDQIYSIDGITRVRTVFNPDASIPLEYDYIPDGALTPRAIDGLSLISWSNGFIQNGEDVHIGNGARQLENFQFPQFSNTALSDFDGKIKIIKKQLSNISTIKF